MLDSSNGLYVNEALWLFLSIKITFEVRIWSEALAEATCGCWIQQTSLYVSRHFGFISASKLVFG